MKFHYPDPFDLSDLSIAEAFANNAIEGHPFLVPEGFPVPDEKEVEAFREFLRNERAKEADQPTED